MSYRRPHLPTNESILRRSGALASLAPSTSTSATQEFWELQDLSPIIPDSHRDDADSNLNLNRSESSSIWTSPSSLRFICLSLHAILVLSHVALLVLSIYDVEHRVVVPLSRSGVTSTIVTIALQTFVTVYAVILVVCTQQLAFRRLLLKRQTLTATHDESVAWTGLGSALLGLYRQFRLTASIVSGLMVAIYLACIAILHITTPALFGMQNFNNTNQSLISTTIGMPEISPGNGSGLEAFLFWQDTTGVLSTVSRLDEQITLGLHNGVLFDVLEDNSGVGNATVGATGFNVTCGSLPNASAKYTEDGGWNVTASYEGYNIQIYIDDLLVPNVLQQVGLDNIANQNLGENMTYLGRNVLFYMATNVSDSLSNNGTTISLQPPMTQNATSVTNDTGSTSGDIVTVDTLQIMGCTLSLADKLEAMVDAQTKEIVSLQPAVEKISSEWTPWHPSWTPGHSLETQQYIQLAVQDPQVDGWGFIFDYAQAGQVPASGLDEPEMLTTTEQYLMEKLGLVPDYSGGVGPPSPPITLHQFENVLANMSALLYWAAANIPPDQWVFNTTKGNNATFGGQATLQYGKAYVTMIASHLNLNVIPIVIGLVASIIILACSYQLTINPSGAKVAIGSLGILETIWAIRRTPQLLELISQVEEPTIDNLRAVGMVEMCLAEDSLGPLLEDRMVEKGDNTTDYLSNVTT